MPIDFDWVVRGFNDPDPDVRTETGQQARQIVNRESHEVGAELVRVVTEALPTMTTNSLVQALRFFQGVLMRFPSTVPAIIQLLRDRRNEPQVITDAVIALGSATNEPDAIEALIREVRDVESPARVEAMNALQAVAGFPQVIAVAGDLGPNPPPGLTRAAIRVLGSRQAIEGQASGSPIQKPPADAQPAVTAGRSEELERVRSDLARGEPTPLVRDAIRRQVAIDLVQQALAELRTMETAGIERQLIDALAIPDLEFVLDTLSAEVSAVEEFMSLTSQVRGVRRRLERLQSELVSVGPHVLAGIVSQAAFELGQASPWF